MEQRFNESDFVDDGFVKNHFFRRGTDGVTFSISVGRNAYSSPKSHIDISKYMSVEVALLKGGNFIPINGQSVMGYVPIDMAYRAYLLFRSGAPLAVIADQLNDDLDADEIEDCPVQHQAQGNQ